MASDQYRVLPISCSNCIYKKSFGGNLERFPHFHSMHQIGARPAWDGEYFYPLNLGEMLQGAAHVAVFGWLALAGFHDVAGRADPHAWRREAVDDVLRLVR